MIQFVLVLAFFLLFLLTNKEHMCMNKDIVIVMLKFLNVPRVIAFKIKVVRQKNEHREFSGN
jgi:hypothetical protein